MVDSDLKELLTDFQNLAESEHHSFLTSIVNNFSYAATIFGALTLFEERPKPSELLQPVCDLLFTIYRNPEQEFRQFALQFLPSFAYLYLQNYSDRSSFHCIETLLVAVHNLEVSDIGAKKQSFKIPTLSMSSIYHDASQMSDSRILVPDVILDKGVSVGNLASPVSQQVSCINAQNRSKVLTHLFEVYTSLLGEYNKQSLDLVCRVCTRMVNRGFSISGIKKTHRRNQSYGSDSGIRSPRMTLPSRIPLCSAVLLEMLHLGYFAIFNGYGTVGAQLARDIEFRGRHESLANVLLLSRAVLKLSSSASASGETTHISTPSQLTKNMITNASFRTKKLDGDIPKVESDDEVVVEKMGVISEEREGQLVGEPPIDKRLPGVQGQESSNITDKFKAKMENMRDNVRIPIRKKEKEKERAISEGSDGKEEKNKVNEKKDKKREKQKNDLKHLVADYDPSSDEMAIRMSQLQTETIAIHSPESGNTSIF